MAGHVCKVICNESQRDVGVYAHSVYEAAILALDAFNKMDRRRAAPRRFNTLTIELRKARTYTVKVEKALDWLYVRRPRTPTERALKRQLQDVMGSERR